MFRLQETRDDHVTLVYRLDDCVGPAADYAKYLETLDESHLDLQGEPIRFVLRSPNARMRALAVDHSVGAVAHLECLQRGEASAAYMRELARYAICDIKNAPADWPKPVVVRERGHVVLSRELTDVIPEMLCYDVANAVSQWDRRVEALKKK